MFLRVKKTASGGYLQIVESYRDHGQVRQRVIGTIGRMEELAARGQVEGLLQSLAKYSQRAILLLAGASDPKAQVKKVGMNINLKLLERQEQRKRKYAGDYDLDYGVGLGNAEADIDSTLFASYYSRSSYNNSKVNDPVLDDLVLAQRRETDPAKRQDLIRRASIRLQEMSWAPYLIYPPKFTFWQPHVKSYHPHFGSKAEFPFVWMER